ncbi:MAG: glutamine amidotransferase [bacterium]|nr:glutamine amidotransferase [bacterium]
MTRKILLVKMGAAPSGVKAKCGDFEDWIRAAGDLSKDETSVTDFVQENQPPNLDSLLGAIVAGSVSMVSEDNDNVRRLCSWVRELIKNRVPTLGICYGHQLMARALGGSVFRNPMGREIGLVEVKLSSAGLADPLFAGLGSTLRVCASHMESVALPPEGAIVLAENEQDEFQAMRMADRAWGVQFHPEINSATMKAIIDDRTEALQTEGFNLSLLRTRLVDSADGVRLLRNFVRLCRDVDAARGS